MRPLTRTRLGLTDDVEIVEDVVLSVSKSFADGAVDAGTAGHTFSIDVTNSGASEADSLQVTDLVDARLIVSGVSGDFVCAPVSQLVDCTLVHLGSGGTASILVTYGVASGTAADPAVANTADATADDGGSDSSSTSVAITTHADVADLKVASGAPHVAGTSVTYTSTVTNNGPSDAQDVTLSDPLDPRLTDAIFCVDTGLGCTPSAPWGGSVNLGTIAAGVSVSVVIEATIDPGTTDGATITNTSTATSSSTVDPTPGNNSDDATITVSTEADLSIVKSGPASATAGDPAGFDYTVTVTNNGPSDNTGGFAVTDTLDAGLVFEAAGSDPACSAVGQDVTCSNASGLVAGESQSFTVHVSVDQTVEGGTVLANSATVASSGTVDPTPGNDTSNTVTTTVDEDVQLSVTKTFDSASVTAGGASRSFTIDVSNDGVSDADNVSLTDLVDSRLLVGPITNGSFDCSASAGQQIDCSLAHLGAGETRSITVDYTVDTTTDSAVGVGNSADVSSDEDSATGSDTVDIVEDVSLRSRRRSTRPRSPRAAPTRRSRSRSTTPGSRMPTT